MQTSEQYRLYLLNLLVEVMADEINELMRYGISPIGVGTVRPLDKEHQKRIRPILEKLSDTVREAAVNMIEETVTTVDEESTAEEWIKIMLNELRGRLALIGSVYAQELNDVSGLLGQIEGSLAGKAGADEEK